MTPLSPPPSSSSPSPFSSSLSYSSPSSLSSLSSLSSPQSRIPTCPLCHQLVLKPRGETANNQIERHIASGCTALVVTSALERRRAKRCRYQHCRRQEPIPSHAPSAGSPSAHDTATTLTTTARPSTNCAPGNSRPLMSFTYRISSKNSAPLIIRHPLARSNR